MVIKLLKQSKIKLLDLKQLENDLEDIFMEIVNDKKGDKNNE